MYRFKKIKNLLVFVMAMSLFTACQKEVNFEDATVNNPSIVDFKVKTYTETVTSVTAGNSSVTYNLSYDGSNRIVRLVDAADSTTKFVYTYNSNSSFVMELFNSGVLSIHEQSFLNSIPLIDSTSQYQIGGDTSLEKYVYDASGLVSEIRDYDYTAATGPQLYGNTEYTYDLNGNILVENDNGAGTVYSYEYDTELNTVNVGLIYVPRNKNLVKKTIIADGTSTATINHTYAFDSNHRVTRETQQYDNGDTIIKSYTY